MRATPWIATIGLCLGFGAAEFRGPTDSALARRPTEAGADEVAARIGRDKIGMDAYEKHLVRVSGRRPLETLIDRLLLEREAHRLELEIEASDITAAVELAWNSYLRRFQGEESGFVRELELGGFRKQEYLANMHDEARFELQAQAVCRASRTVTDAMLDEAFIARYGEDGELVEVRHIFLAPARMRSDLIRDGERAEQLDSGRLDARCRSLLEEVLERLEAGEEFAALAASTSHDYAAKSTGGLFADYNYRAYGPLFASAVRAATVGVPVGPVRTESGFHLIEVVSRVHTEFAEVRAELLRSLEQATAESLEVRAMLDKLRSAVEIETY